MDILRGGWFESRTLWFAGVTVVACGVLVTSNLLGIGTLVPVSKCIASTFFILACLSAGATGSRYGRIVLAGLVFSWFGDMFLLGASEQMFLAGLVSFLVGHIAYVFAFSTYGLNDRWTLAALVPVVVISLAVTVWLTPYLADDMVVPVRVYTFVISMMVLTAYGAYGAGGPLLIPAGATLFYLSDLSVATLQFTGTEFPHYVWGLPFYYTGQLMLALSVAWVRKRKEEQ